MNRKSTCPPRELLQRTNTSCHSSSSIPWQCAVQSYCLRRPPLAPVCRFCFLDQKKNDTLAPVPDLCVAKGHILGRSERHSRSFLEMDSRETSLKCFALISSIWNRLFRKGTDCYTIVRTLGSQCLGVFKRAIPLFCGKSLPRRKVHLNGVYIPIRRMYGVLYITANA